MNDAEELHALRSAAERTRIAMGALNDEILYLREQNDALKAAIAALLKPYPATAQEQIVRAVRQQEEPELQDRPAPVTTPVWDNADDARGETLLERMRTPELWPAAPKQRVAGRYREPLWFPKLAPVTELVRVGSLAYRREFDGDTLTLDRSGAHLAAVSSVEVGHGELVDVGRVEFDDAAGFWLVPWFPWEETGTPHPLGSAAGEAKAKGEVWVPTPRARLLADLARQGRYPELGPMHAYVAEHNARMDRWSKFVNGLRGDAIDGHGRDSDQYARVKQAFSASIALMTGERNPGQGRTFKTRQVRRPDWAFTIRDFAACMMWRWCDRLNQVARAHDVPELAPVAVQAEDEIVIPVHALELVTTETAPGARTPLVIDETGKRLGTFKVKS